jgi:hypothetical protein
MDDSRFTCLQCLHTLVRNTPDAQPLYDDVLHFYASMSMVLPPSATCRPVRRLPAGQAKSCCTSYSQLLRSFFSSVNIEASRPATVFRLPERREWVLSCNGARAI